MYLTETSKELSNKLAAVALSLAAVGLLTSISVLTAAQIFLFLAILTSTSHFSWSRLPVSSKMLSVLCLVMALSVLFNFQDFDRPLKAVFKIRYYLIGAFSIVPLDLFLNQYLSTEKRAQFLKNLLVVGLVCSIAASLSGLVGYWTGFNPILMTHVDAHRSTGTFGLVMTYSHSVAWLSVLLMSLWIHQKQYSVSFPKGLLPISILVSVMGLFASHTRGAVLAFLAGCLAINRKVALFFISFFIVASLVSTVVNPEFVRTQIIRSGSNEERLGCWLGALQAFKNRPVLGYGFMNYDKFSVQIKKEHELPKPEFQGNAHNDFLELLASTGILGALAFWGWILVWWKEVLGKNKKCQLLLFPFVISFLVSGLTQVTFTTSENLIFLMFTYALSLVLGGKRDDSSD